MNSPERDVPTLDTVGDLDSIMSNGLQGLAELLGQKDPNARRVTEPIANRNYQRERVGLRRLFLSLVTDPR